MRARRQSVISGSLLLFPQFHSLFSPSSPLFSPQGDKDPGDLNHKLTIKNVQLTPRSIGDRWNRLDPAHHRRLSFHRNEARRGDKGGRIGRRKGRKLARSWKQSRRFNPARLRSLPGNLGLLPPPPTFLSSRFALSVAS